MLSKQLSEDLVNSLYQEIPEFKTYATEHIDEEFLRNGYIVFGPFGSLLQKWIIQQASKELVDRSYSYINKLCEVATVEIEQMLKVTFFEHLVDFKKTIAESRKNLKGKALAIFEEVLSGPIFDGGKYAK